MSCMECVLCGCDLVQIENCNSVDVPNPVNSDSNPNQEPDSPYLLTDLCIETILNLWGIPSVPIHQLIQNETDSRNLTSVLFCSSCIQSTQEILLLTRQICILTDQIGALKSSLESSFRISYRNKVNNNRPNYAEGALGLMGYDIGNGVNCRIQNLSKHLKLLFAQSLISEGEGLHAESGILFPPNEINSQIDDPENPNAIELKEELDLSEFTEDVSTLSPEEFNAVNTNQSLKLNYNLPSQIKLKEVLVIVEKLSPTQLAEFSINLRKRRNVEKIPKKKSKKNTNDQTDRFPCPIPACKRSFLSEEDRTIHHKKKHEGITHPFTCTECGRKFPQLKLYTVHVNAHRGEYPFICDVCGYGFIKKAALIEHQRSHSSVTEFQCKLCPKAYKGHHGLQYHMRQVHTKERPYTCHVCGKNFIRNDKLKVHMDSVHTKEKSRMCPLCGKMFAIQNYLYMHMRTHEGKPFPSAMKKRQTVEVNLSNMQN